MAYVVEGNLYLQDASKPPLQLTYSGEDHYPIFSDDGKKVAFFRGDVPHDLYVVNSDGSNEQALVTGSLLADLGLGYDELTEIHHPTFLPGTYRVLFDTWQLSLDDVKLRDRNRSGAKGNVDLLVVDANTGEIQSLLSPGNGGRFWVSPEGRKVMIVKRAEVKVITISGQVVHKGRAPSGPGLADFIWDVFWTPGAAAELIVLVPIEASLEDDGWPTTFTVWRYALDDSAPIQVPLDPPPMADYYGVSPDGNWIAYLY